jgi:thioredoxin-like negative regulator of GroEL
VQEWSHKELAEHIENVEAPVACFLYTPFCGTCKLTERMLNILLTMEPDLPIYQSNINFLPQLVNDWQIRSVPCIVILEAGEQPNFMYSMGSVDELYKKLKPLLGKKDH